MASSVRVSTSIDIGGGEGGRVEPDLKRRRLLDAGGPVEDDETARQKMRDAKVYERGVDGTWGEYAGFDPDNVAGVKSREVEDEDTLDDNAITAMGYFAREGDLPMMRWLYVNGADTRDEDATSWWPMYQAAREDNLDICKWLFYHGAAKDIKRRVGEEYSYGSPIGNSPLYAALRFLRTSRNLSRWLILNGALCKDEKTGKLDVSAMRHDLGPPGVVYEMELLLEWANKLHRGRTSFLLLLMGTLSAPTCTYSAIKLRKELLARIRSETVVDRLLRDIPQDEYHLLWTGLFPRRDCPLAVFSGKSGILELIGDYVGIMRGREARIVRQLTELLPGLVVEVASEQAESDTRSDDSDGSDDTMTTDSS